ncbi:hypothetical protein [Fructilactobacillus fructivorans]|uniref:DUF2977 domain-containing protein n=1 Tax=Fructilactobacillus fructivorans TaxID=1614 RepID=A0AAE6P1C5_9LACO|nr:hypothetical protein [Fructilactobacillus fructivorans]KRK58512.1 hypothetical protein FC73_GL000066 [Fructilactobacillus fructivorans]KRN40066.1 hypothetical protein IV51_GL000246 [Fructilactobacillus fructivorans]KRN41827.1 hypothetical protein IV48_GL000668 [Fructilactobacillus fructivorans]QFX92522.1 hypothetical protein LF543_02655 [Fructilactobacillus fructivorans]RDV65883.1 hypothetical protein DXU76_01755 [Fructilactobacillus fructivorans]
MNFYVTVNKNGEIINAQKESFNGSSMVKVPDKYSDYFLDNLEDFIYMEGEPVSTSFPKKSADFDNKIMSQKLNELDKAGDASDKKNMQLQNATAFSIQQTSDAIGSNKELTESNNQLREKVAFLAKQIGGK